MVDLTDAKIVDMALERDGHIYMLLNKQLTVPQLAVVAGGLEVINVEYKGDTRFAILCGRYEAPTGAVAGMLVDPWGKVSKAKKE